MEQYSQALQVRAAGTGAAWRPCLAYQNPGMCCLKSNNAQVCVDRLRGDATVVVGIARDVDVAAVAPIRRPRVLDDPVVLALGRPAIPASQRTTLLASTSSGCQSLPGCADRLGLKVRLLSGAPLGPVSKAITRT